MKTLTLGDIKRDTFVALPNASILCKKNDASCTLCFAYGEKIPVGAFFSQIAGTAPNVSLGLTKLGHVSGVISSIGTDQDGKDALAFLKEQGIATTYVFQKKNYQMTHAVVLNFKGESTQLVAKNETAHQFPKKLPSYDLLHVAEIGDKYTSIFKEILTYEKRTHTPISINPGTIQIKERTKELLALIKVSRVLFVNTKEAALLTKLPLGTPPRKLLVALQKLGPHTVVMTDGAKGAYAAHQKGAFFAPPFPAVRVEATGAGDAFSAGVLGALLEKRKLSDALAWGSINASSVIEYIGPTAGLLSAAQIAKRLRTESSYRVAAI
ncbi:MAG: carbohydrate kinase family protein [Patescibacteria group bacterium]